MISTYMCELLTLQLQQHQSQQRNPTCNVNLIICVLQAYGDKTRLIQSKYNAVTLQLNGNIK